ncbi:MAG: serine/threonine-protein kinase [Deltaproteobacteria bacterium]
MSEPSLAKLLDTFSGRFELRGRLGSGGMGVVYRALDHELGREVALKTLRTSDPTLLYRLKHEFRAAASLRHPNLVQLHELFVLESECFFTMDLVAGVPFTRFVRQGWLKPDESGDSSPPLADTDSSAAESGVVRVPRGPERAKYGRSADRDLDASGRLSLVATQLVRAVAALHDAGLIHCDIKPSNILITEAGRLVLLDFGLSAPLQGQQHKATFSGTLAYAAPEQLWGEPLTPATDWYSVGGVLYEAFTGHLAEGDRRQFDAASVDLPGGVDPRWVELALAMLEPNAADRPGRDALLAQLGLADLVPRRSAAFVGRSAERAALHLALESVRHGWFTVVDVHGESGIGKTELVRQFTLDALHAGALVAQGQCRWQESVAHQALDQVIDELSNHLLALPRSERALVLAEDFASLVRMFPVLGRVLQPETMPEELELCVVRKRAIRGLRQLLWRVAVERALVIWIDDAEWADAESQQFLCDVLRPPAPPLLLVVSHRGAKLPWLSAFAQAVQRSEGQWIDLPTRPLDGESSERLADQLLGTGLEGSSPLAARAAAEGQGVPLFLGQLCRCIAETSRSGKRLDLLALTLAEVVERRIRELSELERRLIELAALVEVPVPVAVLLAAAAGPAAEGAVAQGGAAISRLASARLLQLAGERAEPRVASIHQRVREIVLERMSAATLQQGHLRLVEALDRVEPAPEPGILLHHLLGAGARRRAAALAQSAADAAARRLAFAQAAALYQIALDQLELGSGAEYDALQSSLADALAAAGRAAAAGEQYLLLAERATAANASGLLQRAAENFLIGGLLDRGAAVLARALSQMGLRPPPSSASAAVQGVAQLVAFWVRRRTRSRAPSASEPRASSRAELCLSAAKGFGLVDPMASAYFAFLALNTADRAADPLAKGSALCLSGMILAAAPGRVSAWGMACIDEASRVAEARANPALRAQVSVCRAQVELNRGNWAPALRHCELATSSLARSAGALTWERNMAQVAAVRALEELGELKRAWAVAAEWCADGRQRGDQYAQTSAGLYLAFSRLAADRPDESEQLATQALQPWAAKPPPFQGFYQLRALAYAALYRGAHLQALELSRRGHEVLRRAQLHRFPLAILDVCLLGARIQLGLCRAGGPDAGRHALGCEHDLRRLERLARPDARGHAALLRAGLARIQEQPARARAWLDTARLAFNERQMSLDLAHVSAAECLLDGAALDSSRWLAAESVLRSQGILRPLAWLAMQGVAPEGPSETLNG